MLNSTNLRFYLSRTSVNLWVKGQTVLYEINMGLIVMSEWKMMWKERFGDKLADEWGYYMKQFGTDY